MKRTITEAVVLCLTFLFLVGCVSGHGSRREFIEIEDREQHLNLGAFPPDRPLFFTVAAQPSRGFHYEYYLFVPASIQPGVESRLLVEPNNTGTADDRHAPHAERARRLITDSRTRRIAEQLGTPLIVPTFDRPRTILWKYTHSLDSDTMAIRDGSLARIDLQLLAMIEHARMLLAEEGVVVDERVLMNGFSASGSFVNRFTALHPERVRAVAAGGVNAMPILPLESRNGWELTYHVGIGDIEDFTGVSFDMEMYRTVAQYIYMGELDDNDTFPYDDAYNDDERAVTAAILGNTMSERWRNAQAIYRELNLPVRFVTYADIGHEFTDDMANDITRFFAANMGETVNLPESQSTTVPRMR